MSSALRRASLLLGLSLALCSGLGCERTRELNAQREAQRDPLVLGSTDDFSGNAYGLGVSREFGDKELRQLHAQLNSPLFRTQLERYVCPLPAFTVSVALWYEGRYQERQVRLQFTPRLDAYEPVMYLFSGAVKALDHGPQIDYGYHDPHGKPLAAPPPPVFPEPDPCPVVSPTASPGS